VREQQHHCGNNELVELSVLGQHFLSQAINGENIGLEQVQDGIWNILYYDVLLGRFDQRKKTITGAPSLRGNC
jgi:hypothetical protein